MSRIKIVTSTISQSLLLSFLLTLPAVAKQPVGKAIKVNGSATSTGSQGKRTLSTGSPVFQGDTIKTGYSGRVQMLFADRTKLVVGPRSKVKIDSFIFKNNNTASAFAIKAARGTFRFISGKSKKSVYKISVRTATIGIRGTSFDFANRGKTSVVLYSGSVLVCKGNSCNRLTNKCDLARETSRGIQKSTTEQLVPNAYRLTFPFIRRESTLLPGFRVGAGACDSGVGGGATGGGNGNNGNSGGNNGGTGGNGTGSGSDG